MSFINKDKSQYGIDLKGQFAKFTDKEALDYLQSHTMPNEKLFKVIGRRNLGGILRFDILTKNI